MSPAERLSLKEVAERQGVHYMTVYRHVRTGQLPAILEGARWTVNVADLAIVLPVDTTPQRRRKNSVNRVARLKDRMIAGDSLGSWTILEGAMASGLEPLDLYVDLLVPTLEQIGDDWGTGAISVAEEHRASVVAMRIIGRLGPRFARRGRFRGSVILGTPPGELHGIPALILADLLRNARFEPLDLGTNTPSASFVETALKADRLVAVLIGATTTGCDASVKEVIRALKKARITAPIMVGGRAIVDGDHARRLGATGWTGRHGTDAVLAVEERLGARR